MWRGGVQRAAGAIGQGGFPKGGYSLALPASVTWWLLGEAFFPPFKLRFRGRSQEAPHVGGGKPGVDRVSRQAD